MFAVDGIDHVEVYVRDTAIRWRRAACRTTRAGFVEALKHLAANGVPFHGPIDHGSSESAYFEDLTGNPLEITFDK